MSVVGKFLTASAEAAAAARSIWDGGLVQPHEYIADRGRLHIRYKTATWLRGLIPNPFMRSPKPKQAEIDALYGLLKALRFKLIEARETKHVAGNLKPSHGR